MHEDTIWSNGLAELPGVGYETPPGTRIPHLPRAQATPRVSSYDFGDGKHISLSWELPDGSTSASPASRWAEDASEQELTTIEHLNRLHVQLALPGTPSDYHFAIQSTIETIWGRRKLDSDAATVVEQLCLLSLALVEAYPNFLRYGDHVARVVAFQRLAEMYEKAGDIQAALVIARKAEAFGNDMRNIERLKEKQRSLSEEAVR